MFPFKTDANGIIRLRKHPNVVFSNKNWIDLTNQNRIVFGIPHPRKNMLPKLTFKKEKSQEITIHESSTAEN